MLNKYIFYLILSISAKSALCQNASIIIFTNRYYHDIYIQNPNYSYGFGVNMKIYKNLYGGSEISWLKMKKDEEGYTRTINNKYIYYSASYNESYFIPEFNIKYFIFNSKKISIGISISDQLMYQYYNSINGTFDGTSQSYEIKETSLMNNYLKLSLIANYKLNKKLNIQLQPFFMKNLMIYNSDQSNYGFQLAVNYNIYWSL
jgi:hypothetical protein